MRQDLITYIRPIESRRVVQHACIPTLCLDHLFQLRKGLPICNLLLGQRTALRQFPFFRKPKHIGGQLDADLRQIGRAASLQGLTRLANLQRIPDGTTQRTVHIGDERHCSASHMLADGHHLLCQRNGVLQGLHKGAAAGLDVQKDSIGACGDLFAHNAGSNQRNAVDRSRHIAQRIELFIRGCQVAGLPNYADPHPADNVKKGLPIQCGSESGDGFQFIHRPAGVPQPAAAHLGHAHAQRSDNRRHDQRGLIPHAAGAVFIDLDPVD